VYFIFFERRRGPHIAGPK